MQNWTPEQMCLTPVLVEAWGPFIFVNLNPQARPLHEALLPIAHLGLFREIDYDQYRVETFANYSKQHAPMRPASDVDALDRDRRYLRTEAEEQALYYWLFPNVMLNFYPDNLQINIILPMVSIISTGCWTGIYGVGD